MDNPTNKLMPMGVQSKETVDLAAAKARDALDSAGKTADQTIEKVANKVDDATDGASLAMDKVAATADRVADMATARLASTSQQFRSQVADYFDLLAEYTQNEPVKAMLIAAAAGAALMVLVSLMTRSSD